MLMIYHLAPWRMKNICSKKKERESWSGKVHNWIYFSLATHILQLGCLTSDQAVNKDGGDTYIWRELGMIIRCEGRRLDLLTQVAWVASHFEASCLFVLFFLSNKVETQASRPFILLLAECTGWHKDSILFPLPIAMWENRFNIWLLGQMYLCRRHKLRS